MSLPAARARMLFRGVLLLVLVCALGAVADCRIAAAGDDPGLGRRVYNFRCYYCHGYSGDARTLAARYLVPPPLDFTGAKARGLSRSTMIDAVTRGRPGTAMKPFGAVLPPAQIEAVVDFIRTEFVARRGANTRYHTAANGWPHHERYAAAFPFATGQQSADTPDDALDARLRAGKRLFLSSCISCHSHGPTHGNAPVWERQALSYPRFGFRPGDAGRPPDGVTGATPFARHEVPPALVGLTPQEREGESLYLANCAFCHAADGTAANWIGRFLEPHPRNLTDPATTSHLDAERLRHVIRNGLPGTSMPAWHSVLNDHQIEALIAFVQRAFLRHTPTPPR